MVMEKGKETSVRSENGKRAVVITLSDKGYAGEREDKSGPLVKTMLEAAGYKVGDVILLPDEQNQIERELIWLCDEEKVELILTTGGTGFSPRDCTPEATLAVADRNAPGIAEAMRWMSDHAKGHARTRCVCHPGEDIDCQSSGQPQGCPGKSGRRAALS